MTVKARPHSSEFSDVQKRTKVAETIRIEFVQKVEDLTTTVLMPRPSPNSSLLTEDSDSDCKSKALKQAASQQKQQGLFREADIVLYLCSQDAACHLKTCVTYTYM